MWQLYKKLDKSHLNVIIFLAEAIVKKALLACEIIKDELCQVLEESNEDFDVIWLEEALHERPERLNLEIKKKISELTDYDQIYLSYGLCGNALIGVKAENCEIFFPKIDDCIKGLMYFDPELSEMRRCSVFVSCGWLNTKNNTCIEYNRTYEKYGKEKAQQIFKTMYGNYKNVIYMQSEDEVSEDMIAKSEEMAKNLELELKYREASLNIYRELLTGKESERIGRIKDGEEINFEMFL